MIITQPEMELFNALVREGTSAVEDDWPLALVWLIE